jgi:D-alanyl-D-alanine carboxypeptidase/D-alanyl-D-alanine-endopeptidase (penicillin-binding protein 4)
MLQLFSSGLVSLWLDRAEAANFKVPVNLQALEQAPLRLAVGQNDQIATETVQQYLDELTALGLEPERQGIWLQSDFQVLGDHQGNVPLPAASLTKIATSLVALKAWGPNHQFETQIGTTGFIQGSVLKGDLVIEGGSDPLFVWETAIALGNALNSLGIQQVTGNLVITGEFAMNFERDPQIAGELLKQALNARNWSPDATYYFQNLPAGTPKPQIEIAGVVQVATQAPALQQQLLSHASYPLVQLLKQMNIYSNNEMAEMFARALGGGSTVARQAAWFAAVPPQEIQLVNGSGLGQENRIAPQAVCAMFTAIQAELKRWRSPSGSPYTIADLFPIAGMDKGTVEERKIPATAVVKTGTLSDVSALAGVLPTRDRGLVWFAILNRGDNIDSLRNYQDQTLQALVRKWGTPITAPLAIAPTLYTTAPLSSKDLADQN